MRLIENWRRAHRLWSVRLNAAGAVVMAAALSAPDALAQAWAALPADLRGIVPHADAIALALFVAGFAARIVHQEKK